MRILRSTRFALALGLLVTVTSVAAAANNAGDVKVKNPDGTGTPSNQPHVGCVFYIEGFNMDASSGTITFKVWPPSGDKTVVHATGAAETWTADDTNAHGNHHFLSGPYTLPMIGDHNQGTHYKVFVSDTKHDKMKVFWTKCAVTPPVTPPTPTPTPPTGTPPPVTPPTEQPPTTDVPFFPSAPALVLGALGALGSVFVALRRK